MWRDDFDALGLARARWPTARRSSSPAAATTTPAARTVLAELLLRASPTCASPARATCSPSSSALRRQLDAEGLFEPQKPLRAAARCRARSASSPASGGKARDDVLAGLRRRGWAGRLVWALRAGPGPPRRAARSPARCRTSPRSPEVEVDRRRPRRRLARRPLRLLRRDALPHGRAAARAGDRVGRPPHRPHAASTTSPPSAARRRRTPPRRRCRSTAARRARRCGARRGAARRATAAARSSTAPASLARLSRAPAEHVARHRRALHQQLRELRASARAARRARGARAHARAAPRSLRSRARRPAAGRRRAAPRARAARRPRARARGARPRAHARARLRARRGRRAASSSPTPRAARAAGDVALRFADGAVGAQSSKDPTTDDRSSRQPHLRGRHRRALEEIIGRLDSGEAGLRETLELVPRGPRAGRVLRRRARRRRPRASRSCASTSSSRGSRAGAARGDAATWERLGRTAAARSTTTRSSGSQQDVSSGFTRIVDRHPPARRRRGGRRRGRRLRRRGPRGACRRPGRSLAARRRAGRSRRFCEHLAALDLFPAAAGSARSSRLYRALGATSRPRSTSRCARPARRCTSVLGREPQPVTFVVSLRLGEPAVARAAARSASSATRRCASSSTRRRLGRRADRRRSSPPARSTRVDFKGHYEGTVVDSPADPALYRRVAEAFPDAWIEDPELDAGDRRRCSRPHRDRITWDAPIHSIADIEALPFAPQMVNVKPSRFGGAAARCSPPTTTAPSAASARTAAASSSSAPAAGRSSCSPRSSTRRRRTTCAPGFHVDDPPRGLPTSPLEPRPAATGFRWADPPQA